MRPGAARRLLGRTIPRLPLPGGHPEPLQRRGECHRRRRPRDAEPVTPSPGLNVTPSSFGTEGPQGPSPWPEEPTCASTTAWRHFPADCCSVCHVGVMGPKRCCDLKINQAYGLTFPQNMLDPDELWTISGRRVGASLWAGGWSRPWPCQCLTQGDDADRPQDNALSDGGVVLWAISPRRGPCRLGTTIAAGRRCSRRGRRRLRMAAHGSPREPDPAVAERRVRAPECIPIRG